MKLADPLFHHLHYVRDKENEIKFQTIRRLATIVNDDKPICNNRTVLCNAISMNTIYEVKYIECA